MFVTSQGNNNPFIIAQSGEELDVAGSGTGSDRFLLTAIVTLMMFGLLAVYSAIAYFAEIKGTTAGTLVGSHAVKMFIAVVVMLGVSKINYHSIAKFGRIFVVLSWFFLIAVMLVGTETFGAKRWISIGGFSFQPSSFASVSLIILLGVLLNEKQEYIGDFKRSFLPIMAWVLPTCGLIGIEDFSSAGLLLATAIVVMIVGRIRVMHVSSLILVGIAGGILLISMNPERGRRIQTYVEQLVTIQSNDFSLGNGYQSQQAQIAIARGEVFGVGIGKSSQRDFLPAPYNDFIFAIIAEEYGLVGAFGILSIFVFIFIRGLGFIARLAEDNLGMLLATGATLYICFLGFINAGVASGILPVTGLPMPFVSYGGTSMLFAGILVGILLNISKHKRSMV